jgi:hypothetical protein
MPRSWRSFRTRELQTWGCSTFATWLSTLSNRSSTGALCSRRIRKKPSPRRLERQACLQRVPQQASDVLNLLQRKLMVTLPTSAKLKSEVPTWSVGRRRARTGTVSPGGPDLQRQIEFHTRPVFVWPEFVVGRSKCTQQRADERGRSRDRWPVLKSRHNLRAAKAFTMSFRTPYLWNGTTKKR